MYIPHRDVMKEWWCLTWHFLSGACLVCVLLTWFSASFMIYPNKIDSSDIYSTSTFSTTYAKIVVLFVWFSCLISTKKRRTTRKFHYSIYFSPSMRICAETFWPYHNLFNKYIVFAELKAKPNCFDKQAFFSRNETLPCANYRLICCCCCWISFWN